MDALERGELPAAPQPAGLTVQMRPYQRQSLQFMLDAERGEGGFRRHFWMPVSLRAVEFVGGAVVQLVVVG